MQILGFLSRCFVNTGPDLFGMVCDGHTLLGPCPSLPPWDINQEERSSNLLWQSKNTQKYNLCALISLHQMYVYGIVRNIDLSENRTSYSEIVMCIWYILFKLLRGDYYVYWGDNYISIHKFTFRTS